MIKTLSLNHQKVEVDLKNINHVDAFQHKEYQIPLCHDYVSAGFPSPAQHEVEKKCCLNSLLIKHPAATFFVRASGSSMIGAGIYDNDLLIVDRSLQPSHGKIVIAAINGELTVKRLFMKNKTIRLEAENKEYPPIEITENIELHIWGVVTSVVHYV